MVPEVALSLSPIELIAQIRREANNILNFKKLKTAKVTFEPSKPEKLNIE